ncbi:MAG: hypothetical protein PHO15_03650 [Eubacteriales bacterium]|nr:hypothetical protein [Eubacteriales bacterium]
MKYQVEELIKALNLAKIFANVYSGEFSIIAGDSKLNAIAEIIREHAAASNPQPLSEWHEDMGSVLWWSFPITEPPYCGTPIDENWPGYHTHFTKLTIPQEG